MTFNLVGLEDATSQKIKETYFSDFFLNIVSNILYGRKSDI